MIRGRQPCNTLLDPLSRRLPQCLRDHDSREFVNGHQPVNGSSPWAEQPQLARPGPECQPNDVDFYTGEITAEQVWAVNSYLQMFQDQLSHRREIGGQ